MKIIIDVTDDQARRLLAAAAFVGVSTKELVLGNSFSHLDDGTQSPAEFWRHLRDGVRVYACEKLAVPIDRDVAELYVGADAAVKGGAR